MKKGSCLCGAVTFEVDGEPERLNACHCSECRKQSGHYWAGIFFRNKDVSVKGTGKITWYPVSEDGKRGFCQDCGSFLFWTSDTSDQFVIAGGAFDSPLEQKLGQHIFVEEGDYYDIADKAAQFRGFG